MKTPKASGALRRAPDPMPKYARFTHPTSLRYVGKIGRTRAGAPLDQILDPLLGLIRKGTRFRNLRFETDCCRCLRYHLDILKSGIQMRKETHLNGRWRVLLHAQRKEMSWMKWSIKDSYGFGHKMVNVFTSAFVYCRWHKHNVYTYMYKTEWIFLNLKGNQSNANYCAKIKSIKL